MQTLENDLITVLAQTLNIDHEFIIDVLYEQSGTGVLITSFILGDYTDQVLSQNFLVDYANTLEVYGGDLYGIYSGLEVEESMKKKKKKPTAPISFILYTILCLSSVSARSLLCLFLSSIFWGSRRARTKLLKKDSLKNDQICKHL